MKSNPLLLTCLLTIALVTCCILGLESYWRGRGFVPTFNDDKVLWSTKRKEIYKPAAEATVFIGGSRIKFDLDVPTWEKLTGEKAIQLAIVGTPARLTLRDLANDENFSGKVIIDVAEPQFFTLDSMRRDRFAREALEYYYNETPAQQTSASINFRLESKLVFLEEGKFGIANLLNGLKLTNRQGVFFRPPFPKEFGVSDFNRQNWMTPMFLADEGLKKRQIEIWKKGFGRDTPIKGKTLEVLLNQTKTAIDKIKSRGGRVVFVRPPSNSDYFENENQHYPRKEYWDRLLTYTNTPGIHFSDYPETAHLVCPEWSHLSLKDASIYTSELVKILQEEKGWEFPKKSNSTAQLINR